MRERKSPMNGMLLFLIYGMFALFSLVLVVIGARVYRQVAAVSEENTSVRSSCLYVANKVRMNSGTVRLEQREGYFVLVLEETSELGDYETLIYYYNGALCENYQAAGRSFAPEAGEPITEIAQVVFQEEDPGLLFLRILGFEGNWHGIHLNVRQEREG